MTLSISVLGATGVYARHLIPRLTARGHRVRALALRPEAATVARACGAEVVRADIFDIDSLRTGVRGTDVAVNLATAVPGPSGRGDYATNSRIRREGVPVWLRACEEAGVSRVLQQGIAFINAAGDDWADEDTFVPRDQGASGSIDPAMEMEQSIGASALDWVVLRGASFYGPGTGADDGWFERARAGTLRLPGDGSTYTTLIHIVDMAAATELAIERWPSRQALIIADDAPARWREILSYVCAVAGAPEPTPGPPGRMPSMRLRNTRAREALGWARAYPDYRAGLAR